MDRIKVAAMSKIFKTAKRFSPLRRPAVGSIVWFSPTITLVNPHVAPMTTFHSEKDYLFPCAKGKVIANRRNVVEVRFEKAKENDLVSPEFLESRKFTRFGKTLFGKKAPKKNNIIRERRKKE